jgi:UDP-glucuronate 4-epimerase
MNMSSNPAGPRNLDTNSRLVTSQGDSLIPKQRRILLTGGAGFIGSHVAEALLRRGALLTIVDNLDDFYSLDRKKANLEEIRRVGPVDFFPIDICDTSAMHELMAGVRPEVAIHLAARVGVRQSRQQPRLYEAVNVAGTLNLLELCREFRVQKLIFSSSSSVYGASSPAPFSEKQTALRPASVYAATKLSAETLCYTYAHLFALPVICLRLFTVYGPRQRPDLAIYKFTALIETGRPVPIFGDGSMARDYTHVNDIVAGVLASMDYTPMGEEGVPFDLFNIGNSHPVSLNELIALLERFTGEKAVRKKRPLQPGDVPLTWADISKAKRLLGYRPSLEFAIGIRQFVDWHRNRRYTTNIQDPREESLK